MRRIFRSPSGREWTAYLLQLPPDVTVPGGRSEVLRFESGDVALDLREWPPGWETLSDPMLVELVRRSTTPNYMPRSLGL